RIDTVSFDVDEMKLHLVWRGLIDVADDAATDVVDLFLMTEELGGPRLGPSEVEAKYQAARYAFEPVAQEPDAPAPAYQIAAARPAARRTRRKLRAAGLGGARAAAGAGSMDHAPAAPRAPQALHDPLRTRAVTLLAQGEPLDGEDFSGADLADFDFSRRSL